MIGWNTKVLVQCIRCQTTKAYQMSNLITHQYLIPDNIIALPVMYCAVCFSMLNFEVEKDTKVRDIKEYPKSDSK